MQHTHVFYMSFAIYLMAALPMNPAIAGTRPHAVNIVVALSSITGKDAAGEKDSNKMTGPRIDISKPGLKKQLTAVHDALKFSRIFSEMPLPELAKLNNSFQLLAQSESQIDESLKANKAPDESWLREQQIINAILDKSEADSRQICVYEKLTGSHRSQRVCRTSAEVARLEEKSKNSWQRRGESQLDAPRKIVE